MIDDCRRGINDYLPSCANRFIGESGYAWMISGEGRELLCPVPGHSGKSVFEHCQEFPTILAMANERVTYCPVATQVAAKPPKSCNAVCSGFIQKPFNIAGLSLVIREILDMSGK